MYRHKKLYYIGISEEEYEAKITELIEVEEENVAKNHKRPSKRGNGQTVRGKRNGDSFVFWRQNTSMNGVFYPIFECEKIVVDDARMLMVKVRFNRVARYMVRLLTISSSIIAIFFCVMQGSFELKFVFIRLIFGFFIVLLFQTVPAVSYYNLKKQTLRGMKEAFELKEVN